MQSVLKNLKKFRIQIELKVYSLNTFTVSFFLVVYFFAWFIFYFCFFVFFCCCFVVTVFCFSLCPLFCILLCHLPFTPHCICLSFVQFPESSKPWLMHANYELFPLTLGIGMEDRRSLASKLISLLLLRDLSLFSSRVEVLFSSHSKHPMVSFNSSLKTSLKSNICFNSSGDHLHFLFFALSTPHPSFLFLSFWSFSVGKNKNYTCI